MGSKEDEIKMVSTRVRRESSSGCWRVRSKIGRSISAPPAGTGDLVMKSAEAENSPYTDVDTTATTTDNGYP